MKSYLPLVLSAAFVLMGCEKKNEVPRSDVQPAPSQQQGLNTPASPVPERPAPDVPTGSVAEFPKPGQVNNHSSPEFTGGGVSGKK